MLDYPYALMALPAALALSGMLAGYCLRCWTSTAQTRSLDKIQQQLLKIRETQQQSDSRENSEWLLEIDSVYAEIAELKSLLEVQEAENNLACLTIERLRTRVDESRPTRIEPDAIRLAKPVFGEVVIRGQFDSVLPDSKYGGAVNRDDRLGLVYARPPLVSHNLQRIDGIGSALENQLNDYGVFTFEQIMFWTPHNINEFAGLLDISFDQIERDDWVGQAANLYEQEPGYRRGA